LNFRRFVPDFCRLSNGNQEQTTELAGAGAA